MHSQNSTHGEGRGQLPASFSFCSYWGCHKQLYQLSHLDGPTLLFETTVLTEWKAQWLVRPLASELWCSPVSACEGLKDNAPRREWRYQKMWLCWSKCNLVGGCVLLWAWTLRSPSLKLCSVWYTVQVLLSLGQNVELTAPSPAPCLPVCHLPRW